MAAFRPVFDSSNRLLIGDGTGNTFPIGSRAAGVTTTRFTFSDLGVFTVAGGITLSAFSVAGIVKNSSSGVFSSGLIVDADVTAVGWSKITGTPTTLGGYGITNAVPATATVIGGPGLTASGGPLGSGNVTLAVGANADGSIVVNADDIQVGVLATDAQHGNRGGGALHTAVSNSAAGFVPAITAANRVLLNTSGTAAVWGQVIDAMISTVDWSKITTGKPTTLSGYGINDAVPAGRTLTGSGAIKIAGDNSPHDLSANRTISVDSATTVNPGVIVLAADLAGLSTAPVVVQLTGSGGVVGVLASTIRFADGITPTIAQAQAATGSGAKSSWRAQKGASGSQGGLLELGGGDGGTAGTNLAGDTHIALGQTASNVSAAFRLQSLTVDLFSIAQTASGVTTFDTAGNSLRVAKPSRFDALANAAAGLTIDETSAPSAPGTGAKFFGLAGTGGINSEVRALHKSGAIYDIVPATSTNFSTPFMVVRWTTTDTQTIPGGSTSTSFRLGLVDLTAVSGAPSSFFFTVRAMLTVANTTVPNFENTGFIEMCNSGRVDSGAALLSIFGGDGTTYEHNGFTGRLTGLDTIPFFQVQSSTLLGVVIQSGGTGIGAIDYRFSVRFELTIW